MGVRATLALQVDLVVAQIEAVASDFELEVVKTGMLATAAIVDAVTAAIVDLELPSVVVDPVLLSSSGTPLLDADGVDALRRVLVPRAALVTPNIPEATALVGGAIDSVKDQREAARAIHALGASAVVVTGGHGHGTEVVDVLFDGLDWTELRVPRVAGASTHGTGCTFASAVAAGLARGRSLPEAVAQAQQFVAGALRHARPLGKGRGPLNHFWNGILDT
jgi:hydroxymethylpyrimidine/phosphomethylpyrimidine kinase